MLFWTVVSGDRPLGLSVAAAAGRHFASERVHQSSFDVVGDGLWLHTFVHLHGFLAGVDDDPAVGALADVLVELGPENGVGFFVEEVGEFG